jgi:hypothetical protein
VSMSPCDGDMMPPRGEENRHIGRERHKTLSGDFPFSRWGHGGDTGTRAHPSNATAGAAPSAVINGVTLGLHDANVTTNIPSNAVR